MKRIICIEIRFGDAARVTALVARRSEQRASPSPPPKRSSGRPG
jgi:hypothetical protein